MLIFIFHLKDMRYLSISCYWIFKISNDYIKVNVENGIFQVKEHAYYF